MAINVDYGPIGIAMGLASQGGANRAVQQNNENDMSMLGYAQRAQQMANSQRATEIQQALSGRGLDLEADRNTAQNALAQAQLAATTQYHSDMVQGRNEYQQGRNAIGQQNADTNASRADTADQRAAAADAYHQMLGKVAQQNANTRQQGVQNQNSNAQDANGTRQQDADTKAIQDEFNALSRGVDNHEKNFGDPNDPRYMAAKARLQQIQQQVQTRNTSLLGGSQVKHATPAPQQQQSPGASPAQAVPVKDDADFAALPHGAYFTGPDGVLRQKP